jgi:hypothetical protein
VFLPISDSEKAMVYLAFLSCSVWFRAEDFLHLSGASNSHSLFLLEIEPHQKRKNSVAQVGIIMLLLT